MQVVYRMIIASSTQMTIMNIILITKYRVFTILLLLHVQSSRNYFDRAWRVVDVDMDLVDARNSYEKYYNNIKY